MIYDDYGQPDYEAMILEKQDCIADCDGECEFCFLNGECPLVESEEK